MCPCPLVLRRGRWPRLPRRYRAAIPIRAWSYKTNLGIRTPVPGRRTSTRLSGWVAIPRKIATLKSELDEPRAEFEALKLLVRER